LISARVFLVLDYLDNELLTDIEMSGMIELGFLEDN